MKFREGQVFDCKDPFDHNTEFLVTGVAAFPYKYTMLQGNNSDITYDYHGTELNKLVKSGTFVLNIKKTITNLNKKGLKKYK